MVITDDPTFFRSIQRLMQSTYIDVIHTISVLDALETFGIYDCCLIVAMLMELQEQENVNLPLYEQ